MQASCLLYASAVAGGALVSLENPAESMLWLQREVIAALGTNESVTQCTDDCITNDGGNAFHNCVTCYCR